MKKKKNLVSIIITNYNKEEYLNKSLKSASSQKFKNYEIILFDDCSEDNSLKIIKKYKKIKLIKNHKKKFNSGPLNQIYGIKEGVKSSKGDIVCLLDSDDIFKKNKLNEILNFFNSNLKKNFVVNLPQKNSNFKLKRLKPKKNIWPSIFPTSCISFRKKFFKNFNNYLKPDNFPNLEIDARLLIYSYFFKNDLNIIHKNLTNYVKSKNNISSNYPKFSKKWWFKRKEAFDYLKFILESKKINLNKSLDYYLTNITYRILKSLI